MKKVEMIGLTFGKCVVLAELPRNNRRREFQCQCECGAVFKALGENLRSGHTNSCGCHARVRASEARTTHGHTRGGKKPKLYGLWRGMHQRCNNPNNPRYPRYGGRGIRVDPKWDDYQTFLEDMGPRPSPEHTVGRVDNDGNYGPGNCRWETMEEQANNKSVTVFLTYKGERRSISDWARHLGVKRMFLYDRYARGWSDEKVLATPGKRGNSYVGF